MKKIVTSLLIFLTLFSLLATFCFASETDNASEEAGNVFSEIYDMIILHSDKILSALAFLASLVLAFSYRKGMLPLIKGGLNTLSGAVSKLKEETEQVSLISKETTDSALNRISDVSDLLFTLTEKLSDRSKQSTLRLKLLCSRRLICSMRYLCQAPFLFIRRRLSEKKLIL